MVTIETATSCDQRRRTLLECLERADTLPGVDRGTCGWLRQKLLEESFSFVVAGQFKRGKSSLINALLGAPILPTGVVPLTSIVTILRNGSNARVRIHFKDGNDIEVAPEALPSYVTERGNPRNEKRIDHVVVSYPSSWLSDGVLLIDTPGIGSVYEHNSDVARAYLPRADAVLFVISADQPLSRAELDFLSATREHADKIICVLNKSDYLNPSELPEAVAFTREVIGRTIGDSVPLFAISAKVALADKLSNSVIGKDVLSDEAFSNFEHALRRFLNQDRRAAWLRSVGRSLERVLTQARFAAELETDALKAPLEQITSGLQILRGKSTHIRLVQEDGITLLEKKAFRLLRDRVEPQLESFAIEQRDRLLSDIDRWASERPTLTGGQLHAALQERIELEIRASCEAWRVREEGEIAALFDAACQRFWQGLQQDIDELLLSCGKLFQVAFSSIDTDSLWRFESEFRYKFWNEPPILRTLSTSLVNVLPDFLGRDLILERLRRSAVELSETQVGRLRAGFDARLRDSVQQFGQRMTATSEALLGQLESTIEKALTLRCANEADLNARQQALSIVISSITTVVARVRATASD
jgi:GTP-binding protein EngB required for normal cell division